MKDKKDKKDVIKDIKEKKEKDPDVTLAKPDQWMYDLFSIDNLDLKLKIFSFRFRNSFFFFIQFAFYIESNLSGNKRRKLQINIKECSFCKILSSLILLFLS